MKNRFLMAAICGAAMALTAGTATALPDLGSATTFVQLDWEERPWAAGGGGVSRFTVDGYSDGSGNDLDTGLFGSLNASVYASCFEQAQYLKKGSEWYAVFPFLAGLPSATGGIDMAEQEVIRAIIGDKFGDEFTVPGNSTARDTEDIKALQSILWDAGNGELGTSIENNDAGGQQRANEWLGSPPTSPDFVTLYALVYVEGNPTGGFSYGAGQDFVTYLPGGSPGIPLPAPLMLLGVGLLGLYRFSGRRSRS